MKKKELTFGINVAVELDGPSAFEDTSEMVDLDAEGEDEWKDIFRGAYGSGWIVDWGEVLSVKSNYFILLSLSRHAWPLARTYNLWVQNTSDACALRRSREVYGMRSFAVISTRRL